MFLDERVPVKVNSNHLKQYRRFGYSASVGQILYVSPTHLPSGSHARVNIKCDLCDATFNIQFRGISNRPVHNCKSCSSKERIKKYGSNFDNPALQRELSLRNTHNSLMKSRKTKLEKYGSETFNNQKKKEKTCLNKYGVRHTNQFPEIWNKIQKNSFKTSTYNGILYQGSYELDFLIFCNKNNIIVERGPAIPYNVNNNTKIYHSDFFIRDKNLIVEIKSTYTYKNNIKINFFKKESCEKLGYNFVFIIDKNYSELIEIINERKQNNHE